MFSFCNYTCILKLNSGGQIRRADDDPDAVNTTNVADVVKDRVKMNKFKSVFDDMPDVGNPSGFQEIKDLYEAAKKDKTGRKQRQIAKLVNATVIREKGKLMIKTDVPYVEQQITFNKKKFYHAETAGAQHLHFIRLLFASTT